MLTIEVDSIGISDNGIAIGCIVRYGENGPVRFVRAELPLGLLPPVTLGAILRMWDRENGRIPEPDDIPLF